MMSALREMKDIVNVATGIIIFLLIGFLIYYILYYILEAFNQSIPSLSSPTMFFILFLLVGAVVLIKVLDYLDYTTKFGSGYGR
jgi:TRAP-type C4-dicarboxylate transport system permease small subunit